MWTVKTINQNLGKWKTIASITIKRHIFKNDFQVNMSHNQEKWKQRARGVGEWGGGGGCGRKKKWQLPCLCIPNHVTHITHWNFMPHMTNWKNQWREPLKLKDCLCASILDNHLLFGPQGINTNLNGIKPINSSSHMFC